MRVKPNQSENKKYAKKTFYEVMGVVGIILLSTMPYFHDAVTEELVGVRKGIPILGIEKALTLSEGNVWGFRSYRIFLYMLFLNLFPHIGFVGWMMDAKGKYYRAALLVPVILSGYSVAIIFFNARQTDFNTTSAKFYVTMATTLVVLVYYVLDRRGKTHRKQNEQYEGTEVDI